MKKAEKKGKAPKIYKEPLLISIHSSHYCEKVKWGLDYLKIKYREEAHPPLLHFWYTRPYKTRTVPILLFDDKVLKDSTDILKYLDTKAPVNLKLYPTDPKLKKEVEDLEEYFDTKFGPHTRRWVYHYLLDRPDILVNVFGKNTSVIQESVFDFFSFFIRRMMRYGMKINPKTAERSHSRIIEVFNYVEERMKDGRKYLVGNKLSAADITFASLAAPALLPPEYWRSSLDKIPPLMLSEVQELRKHKAAKFVMRIYQKDRREDIMPIIADAPEEKF